MYPHSLFCPDLPIKSSLGTPLQHGETGDSKIMVQTETKSFQVEASKFELYFLFFMYFVMFQNGWPC